MDIAIVISESFLNRLSNQARTQAFRFPNTDRLNGFLISVSMAESVWSIFWLTSTGFTNLTPFDEMQSLQLLNQLHGKYRRIHQTFFRNVSEYRSLTTLFK
jgi:hypothetical protein